MNKSQRITYHTRLWPAAAKAQGFTASDANIRRAVTARIMRAIGSPATTTSDPRFGQPETTALFTALRHLGEPDSLTLRQRWLDCQADFVAFHQAKQADYWQDRAYGKTGGTKITRQRFGGRKRAQADDPIVHDPISREEAAARLQTMRARARAKRTAAA
jgi:hypothetical protein